MQLHGLGRPTRLALVLALIVFPLVGATASRASTCARGITLTSSFERATWVVVATVDIFDRQGSNTRAVLRVEEQFKGPELESFSLSRDARMRTSGGMGIAEGERWLLFLPPSRENSGAPGWPGGCGGSLALKADRYVHTERAATHLAALRSQQAKSMTAPADPWLFREHAGAVCMIRKPFRGPRGAGHLGVRTVDGSTFVTSGFFPKRERAFPLTDDSRDLRIDVDGEFHEVGERRHSPWQRGNYRAQDGTAELLLNALQRLELQRLRVSLGGDFATDVGVFGLQAALDKLEACRERERPPRAGWLEVWALPERGQRDPLGFSWSIARADRPGEPIVTDGRYADWETLSAGRYVVNAECYGEQRQENVRVVEGKTERLYIRCGNHATDN